ncbi:MAG: hypothetical protein NC453_16570 [Muribaculum sp.]|nr:hypothetical protein [Muribaculum sp.]
MKILYIINILLSSFILFGCAEDRHSDLLERIDALCDNSPKQAIKSLDSLSHFSLCEQDRHYRDLLYIKARDKAYIQHTSDSLILDVIEYYANSSDKIRLAESLYYGGRVYSDMGDYPSALNYFQNALDEISNDPASINLKSKILIQTSDILISLRLPQDARHYSEEALKIDIKTNDSVSIMYDYEQLGAIEMQSKQYETAESYYKKAKQIAQSLNDRETVSLNATLASIKYFKEDIDSALVLIRYAITDIDSTSRNTALACASLIYREKNIKDTALLYAKELISRKDFFNRKTGYNVLLSDGILPLLHKDTVIEYVKHYRDEIESYLNKNGDQSALMQNSFYNYQIHLRDKVKAEKVSIRQRTRNMILILAMLALLFILICVIVINKYRTNKLRMALFTLTQMRLEISNNRFLKANYETHQISTEPIKVQRFLYNHKQQPANNFHDIGNIKNQIRAELKFLLANAPLATEIPAVIIESGVYVRLYSDIEVKNIIPENDAIWQELEKIICEYYPMFKMRLINLSGHKLNKTEKHILLMVKIGVSPTDMSVLLGRSKSTISFNRHSIARKLFGEKMALEKIDRLIRIM